MRLVFSMSSIFESAKIRPIVSSFLFFRFVVQVVICKDASTLPMKLGTLIVSLVFFLLRYSEIKKSLEFAIFNTMSRGCAILSETGTRWECNRWGLSSLESHQNFTSFTERRIADTADDTIHTVSLLPDAGKKTIIA
jgi:hypothetical protein